MRPSRPADDGPTLTDRERRALEQIAVELGRDTRLARCLTPGRHRFSLQYAAALVQAAVGGVGLGLMTIGLIGDHVLIAAPGFLALVAATSALISHVSLETFGLVAAVAEPTDGGFGD